MLLQHLLATQAITKQTCNYRSTHIQTRT